MVHDFGCKGLVLACSTGFGDRHRGESNGQEYGKLDGH